MNKQFNKVHFLLFLLGIIIMRAGWFMTLPFMAFYLSKSEGMGPAMIGLILGSGAVAACIASFWGGIVADSIGPRRVMLQTLLASSVLFFICAIWLTPLLFTVSNILLGLLRAVFETASKSYIAETIPEEKKPLAFSGRYTAINIGAAVGPIAGAYFITLTPKIAFLMAGVLYLLSTITFLIAVNHPQKRQLHQHYSAKEAIKVIGHDSKMLAILLVGFIIFAAYAQLESTLPLVLTQQVARPEKFYSMLLMLNALVIIILQVPINSYLYHLRLDILIWPAVLLFAVAFFALAAAKTYSIFFISVFLISVAEIINVTLNNIIIDRVAPTHMKGAYFGASGITLLGFSLGPALGGYLLEYYGQFFLYGCMGLLLIPCLFLYQISIKAIERNTCTNEEITKC